MINGEVKWGKELDQRLKAVVPSLRTAMDKTIAELCLKLSSRVKEKLSGEVLKNRTGRLRRSINFRMTGQGTQDVVGFVGTNVEYAGVHEYGFEEVVTVKAHLRRSKAQMKLAVLNKKTGRETLKSKAKWKGKGEVMVGSHSRQMNMPKRSFLRSARAEMEPEINAAIEKATKKAAQEAMGK